MESFTLIMLTPAQREHLGRLRSGG